MGFRDRREQAQQEKAQRDERNANPEEQWEYLARNLAKVPGMALESDFNKFADDREQVRAVLALLTDEQLDELDRVCDSGDEVALSAFWTRLESGRGWGVAPRQTRVCGLAAALPRPR